MLVTFTSASYPDITLFGDVAHQLLKMMGYSGVVPSALVAKDVRAARQRFEAAIAAQPAEPAPEARADNADDEPTVSLALRALPLIELLKAAEECESDVLWKTN
jgi:hypothetical protein